MGRTAREEAVDSILPCVIMYYWMLDEENLFKGVTEICSLILIPTSVVGVKTTGLTELIME
jgi:hypothetical protein